MRAAALLALLLSFPAAAETLVLGIAPAHQRIGQAIAGVIEAATPHSVALRPDGGELAIVDGAPGNRLHLATLYAQAVHVLEPGGRVVAPVPSAAVKRALAAGAVLRAPSEAELQGWRRAMIPAGTYAGQDEPLASALGYVYLAVAADLDRAVVFDIALALMDGRTRLAAADAALAGITPRMLAFGIGVPTHPGAEAAYRERGLLP